MTTFLLILHGLCAVALLGGLTHQAFAVLWPARAAWGFTSAYRAVSAARFTNANITFYVMTFALGALIYPPYRIAVRTWIERARLWHISGLFEFKEQALAIASPCCRSSGSCGATPRRGDVGRAQVDDGHPVRDRLVSFIAGHIVNNVRGLFGQ